MSGYYDRDRNTRTSSGHAANAYNAAGTMNHAYSHHGNVAEYQASGFPLVQKVTLTTGQEAVVNFPFVTQWISFATNGNDAYVAFSESGQEGQVGSGEGTNYFPIQTAATGAGNAGPIFRIKCNKVFLKDVTGASVVYIIAGLTNVPASEFPDISSLVGVGTTCTISNTVR